MALVSGTYTRYPAQGLREQLSDVIYNISPVQFPFMSGAGVGERAKQTLVEWQTEDLAAVDTANKHLEGDDAAFTTPAATVRVGNYTQISRKTLVLSDTLEVIDKAGRRSELAHQMAKRGKEIKRDQEAILLENAGGDAGGVGTARALASMGAWLKTNTSFGATGADPTYTSGVPSAPRTDATSGDQRAFTETLLKNVIQSMFDNGGEASVLMVGAFNKRVVSGFSGIAVRNFDLSNVSPRATAVIGAVDVYVSDFATVRVIPNRFQRPRDAWLLDWDLVSVRYLRPHYVDKLGKSGDAEKRLLRAEYTLQVKQEAGLGLVADLTTA